MRRFVPNFVEITVRCPNPQCPGQDCLQQENNQLFRTGWAVEMIVLGGGMVPTYAFVLGMRDCATCSRCQALVPVPCLFPNENVCADFWKRSGQEIVSWLWISPGNFIFPSFVGIDFSQMDTQNQRAFFKKQQKVIVNALRELPSQKQDFLFLEMNDFRF